MCVKCVRGGKGMWMVVAGVLVLLNIYFLQWSWPTFIGVLLIVIGLGKMLTCCCKPVEMKMPVAAKKKK